MFLVEQIYKVFKTLWHDIFGCGVQNPQYDMNTVMNTNIISVLVIRDQGVIHDAKLIFDKHIDSIISKASRALGFISHRAANSRSVKFNKVLYFAFVRSHLKEKNCVL